MRARFPFIIKIVALGIFLAVAGHLGVYMIGQFKPARSEHRQGVQLPGQLTGVFEAFKYVHHEGGRNRYTLTAAKDKVFGDGHHDLANVKLEIYDTNGAPSGQVTSDRCRYDQSQALVHFESNVLVDTSDGLKVKTEVLDYNQQTDQTETEEVVEFVRGRAHGNCRGALLDSPARRLEMKAEVHVTVDPETAGAAQQSPGKSEQKAAPASAQGKKIDEPVEITGNWAEYTGKDRCIKLRGSARIAEPDRSLSAEAITAFLDANNKIERAEARGESVLESQREGLPGRVKAAEMDFFFDERGNITRAEARVNAEAEETDADRRVTADRLELFAVPGASGSEVQHIKATGNVHVKLAAPAPTEEVPNPTAKDLVAEDADLYYYPGGRFLREAEAHGHVVITLTPIQLSKGAERRTLRADQCKLTFFETDNDARELFADGAVKIEVVSYELPSWEKTDFPRITESAHAHATFNRESGDIATAVQEGDFKYEEGPSHAVADRANYDAAKELIELRGGKVAVWNDTSHTRADEIDLLTEKEESFARGHVRSTYYNPDSTGQATPFRNMKSPVFITAKEAHIFNQRGEAIYTGDARAWQDDSFVRADRLELYREGQHMVAVGNVSSALYQVKSGQVKSVSQTERKEGDKKEDRKRTLPVFATSDTMTYSDQDRVAEYKGAVKMRQGDETLEAERVKIFLQREVNEIDHMEAYDRVVVTQPGRRAEGDRAEYTALDDRTVMIGSMARAISQTQGTVTGRRLTLMGGDDKIFVDDQRGAKRVRSTHEVRR